MKLAIEEGFNGWVRIRREVPGAVGTLVLPQGASREGRSSWFMDQPVDDMNLKVGDQIIPMPEAWLYKVNHDDKDCPEFAVKKEHILAKVRRV